MIGKERGEVFELTDSGMKRLGLRSSFVSTMTNVDAGTDTSQTIEPQLFYDRMLGIVIFLQVWNIKISNRPNNR